MCYIGYVLFRWRVLQAPVYGAVVVKMLTLQCQTRWYMHLCKRHVDWQVVGLLTIRLRRMAMPHCGCCWPEQQDEHLCPLRIVVDVFKFVEESGTTLSTTSATRRRLLERPRLYRGFHCTLP